MYTEEDYEPELIQVPNVLKYRADDANELLTAAGLNYISQGASTDRTDVLVGEQSVEPGTFVEVGTVIQLDYVVNDQSG